MPLAKRKPEPRRTFKRHDGLTPKEAALRFAMAKAQPPKRNHDAVIELARELGADVADAIDWYEDRASQREYEANLPRADAERLALEDVREILTAKIHRR